MKTTREKKNLKTVYSISAGVLALICAANVAVLSSCSYVEAADDTFAVGTAAEEPYLYDPIETAFANYFCVPDYDAITDEQFAQIESVDVYLVMPQMSDTATVQAYGSAIPPQDEDLYPAAYVSINGKPVEMLMPCVLEKDVFENQIVPGLHAWDEEVGAKDVYIKRLQAFYCIKDPADPELEERAVAEMQALFPITKTTPVALYDPYSTKREDHYLYQILFETGMVNDAAFSDTALHAKLGSIPALDDAQITVTVAETLNDFAVDSGLFKDQSQSFKDYMSAYMDANQKKAEELSELIAAEYAQQMDINGNGIIGE